MTLNKRLEFFGSIGVIVATLIVTSNIGFMILAFLIYSFANTMWIWLGVRTDMKWLVAMNAFLILVNIWGIYRWL